MSLIHQLLIFLGLVARQIREDARKGDEDKRCISIGPPELTKQVHCECSIGLSFIHCGVLIYFSGEDGVVATDLCIAFIEALQLKELERMGISDVIVDI